MFSLPVFGSKLWQVVVNFIPDPFFAFGCSPSSRPLAHPQQKFRRDHSMRFKRATLRIFERRVE